MKVALTGITGHLGCALARELYSRNYTIRALIRSEVKDWFDDIPIEFVKGDLFNQQALNDLMMSCDVLIHSAAYISIHGDPNGLVHKTNVEGTRNVMEAALAAGIKRVIHISSIHTFRQEPMKEILDEHREKVNHDAYAYDNSKREGEIIALSYASETMDVLVMSPTSFIGPYDYKPSLMGQAIIKLAQNKLPFVIRGGFDFCDVRDVANAIVNALTIGRNGESYLLSGKWHNLREISNHISNISNKKINVSVLPNIIGWIGLPFIFLLARIRKEVPLYTNESLTAVSRGNRNISSSKAERELQFTARPIEVTLRDTYEWFLKHGYLDHQ